MHCYRSFSCPILKFNFPFLPRKKEKFFIFALVQNIDLQFQIALFVSKIFNLFHIYIFHFFFSFAIRCFINQTIGVSPPSLPLCKFQLNENKNNFFVIRKYFDKYNWMVVYHLKPKGRSINTAFVGQKLSAICAAIFHFDMIYSSTKSKCVTISIFKKCSKWTIITSIIFFPFFFLFLIRLYRMIPPQFRLIIQPSFIIGSVEKKMEEKNP